MRSDVGAPAAAHSGVAGAGAATPSRRTSFVDAAERLLLSIRREPFVGAAERALLSANQNADALLVLKDFIRELEDGVRRLPHAPTALRAGRAAQRHLARASDARRAGDEERAVDEYRQATARLHHLRHPRIRELAGMPDLSSDLGDEDTPEALAAASNVAEVLWSAAAGGVGPAQAEAEKARGSLLGAIAVAWERSSDPVVADRLMRTFLLEYHDRGGTFIIPSPRPRLLTPRAPRRVGCRARAHRSRRASRRVAARAAPDGEDGSGPSAAAASREGAAA